MRVLHVYKTYLPENFTGVPRVIFDIAEGLVRKGISNEVLALAERPSAAPVAVENHTVHQVRRDLHVASTGLSLSVFRRFSQLVEKVDLIHYHFPWPVADQLFFWLGRNKPSVVTYHSDIIRQKLILPFYTPVMHAFLRRANAIVATSPNYAETSPVLAHYRQKLAVIPIGIPERAEVSAPHVDKWRHELGDDFFLFVGALRYYKGLKYLVEAARRTGLPVVVAGAGDRARAGVVDPPENVRFLGAVSDEDKEALLSLCRAFVFPSHLRSEAFGIALAEAARAGKPMISSDIGTGTSYVNAHGETGLVVPPADPAALAEAMTAIADNAEHFAHKGTQARARYERLFRAEDMSERYFRLYHQLLDQALAA